MRRAACRLRENGPLAGAKGAVLCRGGADR